MSWFSVWFKAGGKSQILGGLLSSLIDGQITLKEVSGVVLTAGVGVLDVGLHKQIQQAYDYTAPDALQKLLETAGAKEALAQIAKVHAILGAALEGVKQ